MHRYHKLEFNPWWFVLAPVLWGTLLVLGFGNAAMKHHYEPGVRYPVQAQMDIPLCYQVEGLPPDYCDYLTNEEAP